MNRIIFSFVIYSLLFATDVFAQRIRIINIVPNQSCDKGDTISVSNIYVYRADKEFGDKEVKIYFFDSLLTSLQNRTYMVYTTSRKGLVKLKSTMYGKTSEVVFWTKPGRVYYVESRIKGKK